MISKAGFVALIGRPNSGKSTLLNHLAGENLALVSHKANATRDKMYFIIPHTTKSNQKCQIVFIDTPGLHKREKALNQFMLEIALKVMSDCDLCVFMAVVGDDVRHYEEFLDLCKKPHILVLSKIDKISHNELFKEIKKYEIFTNKFISLIPISTKKSTNINTLLDSISENLPESSAFFNEDDLTTRTMREITKEMIRESVFENVSDELPYESDVLIECFKERQNGINEIRAKIYVRKQSQKIIMIGKSGATIKRISTQARIKIENLMQGKVFLRIDVVVNKDWAKDKKSLKNLGYEL